MYRVRQFPQILAANMSRQASYVYDCFHRGNLEINTLYQCYSCSRGRYGGLAWVGRFLNVIHRWHVWWKHMFSVCIKRSFIYLYNMRRIYGRIQYKEMLLIIGIIFWQRGKKWPNTFHMNAYVKLTHSPLPWIIFRTVIDIIYILRWSSTMVMVH